MSIRYWLPLLLVCTLLLTLDLCAQSVEWVGRVQRIEHSGLLSSLTVAYDKQRGRLCSVGWGQGVILRSDDSGKTWYGAYLPFADVLSKAAMVSVLENGLWVYQAETPWNERAALLSADGGDTWQYLGRDTTIFSDPLAWLHGYVRPNALIASGKESSIVTFDNGNSWKKYPLVPLEGTLTNVQTYPLDAHVTYFSGDPTMRRWDMERDTTWKRTLIPKATRPRCIAGNTFIGTTAARVLLIQTHPDSAARMVTEIFDSIGDTVVALRVETVKKVNDSVAYVFDANGYIIKVNLQTGVVTIAHRTLATNPTWVIGPPVEVHVFDGLLLVRYNDRRSTSEALRNDMRYVVIDDAHNSISEYGVMERISNITGGASLSFDSFSPYTYLGDVGLFMSRIGGGIREVMRSTDFGRTWIHPKAVTIPTTPILWMSMRSAVLSSDDSVIMQSNFGHMLREIDGFPVEVRQYTSDAQNWYEKAAKAYTRVPSIQLDEGRILACMPQLCELDPKTGMIIDTLLPHKASFVRRVSASTLMAGRDSLWISKDDGVSWQYGDAGLSEFADSSRGSVSDAASTVSGVMLCALRGITFIDDAGVKAQQREGGVSKSTDGGDTWTQVPNWPADFQHVSTLAALASGTILAAASEVEVDARLFDPAFQTQPDRVVKAGLFRSADEGATWTQVYIDLLSSADLPDRERSILQMPNGTLLATTLSGQIIQSIDDGLSWLEIDVLGLEDVGVNGLTLQNDATILLATTVGVARLTLSGISSVEAEIDTTGQPQVTLSTEGVVSIRCDASATRLRITSLDGRVVCEQPLTGGQHEIDASSLARGPYTLSIITPLRIYHALVLR